MPFELRVSTPMSAKFWPCTLELLPSHRNLELMLTRTSWSVRPPAVAGQFYSDDNHTLQRDIAQLLSHCDATRPAPKALIVPHAGYRYCGALAAKAYASLRKAAGIVRRVVLLGPSHRVALTGIAVPSVNAFRTPLGDVALECELLQALARERLACISDVPHQRDHALEVQLPFLQVQLGEFQLVPLAVGECAPHAVATVLERVWGDAETLIVVSTDLSHFKPSAAARIADRRTCEAITRAEGTLRPDQACGCHALNGLLSIAASRSMRVELLGACNSGDVTGEQGRVVGYASFAIHEY